MFPSLDPVTGAEPQFTPYVPGSVTLADGSSYTFRYNGYADIASIKLPTGGLISYVWPSSVGDGAAGACTTYPYSCALISDTDGLGNPIGLILRRLLSRSEYSDTGGSVLTRTTQYTPTFAADQYGQFTLTETDLDQNGAELKSVKHHFLGDSLEAILTLSLRSGTAFGTTATRP